MSVCIPGSSPARDEQFYSFLSSVSFITHDERVHPRLFPPLHYPLPPPFDQEGILRPPLKGANPNPSHSFEYPPL